MREQCSVFWTELNHILMKSRMSRDLLCPQQLAATLMPKYKTDINIKHLSDLTIRTAALSLECLLCPPLSPSPTDKVVPLGVQVSLVGEAALHHVKAQRVAGPQRGHAPAQRAVPLPHQGTCTLRTSAQLENTQ